MPRKSYRCIVEKFDDPKAWAPMQTVADMAAGLKWIRENGDNGTAYRVVRVLTVVEVEDVQTVKRSLAVKGVSDDDS